jgi:heterodisulfide reductase subunit A-like polyferredoxin
MVEVGQHPDITLLSYSEVENVSGYIGNFTVTIRKRARHVDESLCTGCGICEEKCPRKVIDEIFEAGLSYRKAIYRPFPQAVPKYPVLDVANCTYFEREKCKACQIFCPTEAIDFEQEDQPIQIQVAISSWRLANGLFDARQIPQYGLVGWQTCSLVWSSNAWSMQPAQREVRSYCAMGSRNPRVSLSSIASAHGIKTTTSIALKYAACIP